MKKLLLLVIGLVIFVPTTAKAVISSDCNSRSLRAGESGTCTVHITNASNLSTFRASVTSVNPKLQITRVRPLGDFIPATGNTVSPANVHLTSNPAANGRVPVMEISFTLQSDWTSADGTTCPITILVNPNPTLPPPTTPPPTTPPGTPPTTPPTTPPNPDTGQEAIPYIIIGSGVVIALSALYVAARKKKFYKI